MTDTKPLPWSCEAEQSLLGGLLQDADALLRIADHHLLPAHFFDARHQAIYAAVTAMAARREPVDLITLFEQLQRHGQADDCGGLEYLNQLAESVPSAANIGRYADLVVEKALRRAIIAAADRAQTIAHEAGDADAALDRVATLFGEIKRSRATSATRSLSELLAERIDHWQGLADGEIASGIRTGIALLDEALSGGLKPGKLIVLAARPSIGKTSLATSIMLSCAGQGNAALMLSQEMPAGDLVDRIAANLGRVGLGGITTGRFEGDGWARLTEASETAARLNIFIDDTPALTLLDIRAKARQVQQRHGLALLVVDYLQLCSNGAVRESRNLQIEEISRGLKTLAKELSCTVLALSQLNRNASDREPELADLRDSGAIEQDADTVLMLHPLGIEADGSMTVLGKLVKNRQGRRGRLALSFDGRTQRWAQSSADVSRNRAGGGQ